MICRTRPVTLYRCCGRAIANDRGGTSDSEDHLCFPVQTPQGVHLRRGWVPGPQNQLHLPRTRPRGAEDAPTSSAPGAAICYHETRNHGQVIEAPWVFYSVNYRPSLPPPNRDRLFRLPNRGISTSVRTAESWRDTSVPPWYIFGSRRDCCRLSELITPTQQAAHFGRETALVAVGNGLRKIWETDQSADNDNITAAGTSPAPASRRGHVPDERRNNAHGHDARSCANVRLCR